MKPKRKPDYTGRDPRSRALLRAPHATGDPLIGVLANATEVEEPLTDADRAALDEGRLALDAGDTVSDDELRSQLGK